MSEAKFVVGQWVTCFGRPFRVKQITEQWMHADEGYSTTWANVEPFVWQVGKTYKTTLDGVTATIDAETTAERVVAIISNGSRLSFSGVDGELMPMHKKNGWPTHLLPYRADEPPPVAEAATFSEFAEADECDTQPAAHSSMENKIAGIYCCDVVQYFNFNIGSAIASLWTCDVGTNADDAMLSLKAAAWFVQREIERREKGGER